MNLSNKIGYKLKSNTYTPFHDSADDYKISFTGDFINNQVPYWNDANDILRFDELNKKVDSYLAKENYSNKVELINKTNIVTKKILSNLHGFINNKTSKLFVDYFVDSFKYFNYITSERPEGNDDQFTFYKNDSFVEKIFGRQLEKEKTTELIKTIFNITWKPLGHKTKNSIAYEKLFLTQSDNEAETINSYSIGSSLFENNNLKHPKDLGLTYLEYDSIKEFSIVNQYKNGKFRTEKYSINELNKNNNNLVYNIYGEGNCYFLSLEHNDIIKYDEFQLKNKDNLAYTLNQEENYINSADLPNGQIIDLELGVDDNNYPIVRAAIGNESFYSKRLENTRIKETNALTPNGIIISKICEISQLDFLQGTPGVIKMESQSGKEFEIILRSKLVDVKLSNKEITKYKNKYYEVFDDYINIPILDKNKLELNNKNVDEALSSEFIENVILKEDINGEIDGRIFKVFLSINNFKVESKTKLIDINLIKISDNVVSNVYESVLNYSIPEVYNESNNVFDGVNQTKNSSMVNDNYIFNYNVGVMESDDNLIINWNIQKTKFISNDDLVINLDEGLDSTKISYAQYIVNGNFEIESPILSGGNLYPGRDYNDSGRNLMYSNKVAIDQLKEFDNTIKNHDKFIYDLGEFLVDGNKLSNNKFTTDEAIILSITTEILNEVSLYFNDSQVSKNKSMIEYIGKEILESNIIPSLKAAQRSIQQLGEYTTGINYIANDNYERIMQNELEIKALNNKIEKLSNNNNWLKYILGFSESISADLDNNASKYNLKNINKGIKQINNNGHDISKLDIFKIGNNIYIKGRITLGRNLFYNDHILTVPISKNNNIEVTSATHFRLHNNNKSPKLGVIEINKDGGLVFYSSSSQAPMKGDIIIIESITYETI